MRIGMKGLPSRPGKVMGLGPRHLALLVLAVLAAIQAGCGPAPAVTPQPSLSAAVPMAMASATVPAGTPTAAPAAPTPITPVATVTAAPATATALATIVQMSATPTALRTPTSPPAPAQPPAESTPPRPTAAAFPLPLPVPPTPCPQDVSSPVTSLVVTPSDPPVYYLVADGHIYRSTDKGQIWSTGGHNGQPPDVYVYSLAVDRWHSETLYAMTAHGIYRRQGEGTWELVNALQPTALVVDGAGPDVLWAKVSWPNDMNTVVKSEDAGRTWVKADWGMPPGKVGCIVADPDNPNVLWALVGPAYGVAPAQLYRGSRDGHWERLDLALSQLCGSGDCCFPGGMVYGPGAGLLFVGCASSVMGGKAVLLRSPNADAADPSAVRWEAVTSLSAEVVPGISSAQPLAVDAEPGTLFVATTSWLSGKVRYRVVVSHDDGATWETLQLRGLPRAFEQ